jgi:DNA-binding NtrC family response regulator/tetratricopeptide (TPR) repeat protein
MQLFADRFLIDATGTVDLATGELIRLTIEHAPDRQTTQSRTALCDLLSGVRHPLLLPLVDYGIAHDRWFEAHQPLPPLRASPLLARRTALHLARFLEAAGIAMEKMNKRDAERHIRKIADEHASRWRPVGVTIARRASIETIQTLLEADGPPGVARVDVCGVSGAGLRTTRLCAARAARLAGLIPIDAALAGRSKDAGALCRDRHVCVMEWSSSPAAAAYVLALAARGGSRHLLLRFHRSDHGADAIVLERLTVPELCAAVHVDPDIGPDVIEMTRAASNSDGLPGVFIRTLASRRKPGGSGWLHETAPEYVIHDHALASTAARTTTASAGIARLERVVAAARTLAARGRHARAERLLRRAMNALAARHASRAAAMAACDLGDLLLGRCRADEALNAYARSREWCVDADLVARGLLGSGRAMLDAGRMTEAEAAFRTLIATGGADADARQLLAETLSLRGDTDAADALLDHNVAAPASVLALRSEFARRRGDLVNAGRWAADALSAAAPDDHASICSARLAAMHVQASLRNRSEVERHARAARRAARASKSPMLVLKSAADVYECLASCGVMESPTQRSRLLAAARHLPLLRSTQIRRSVCGIDSDVRRVASCTGALALIEPDGCQRSAVDMLEELLHLTHDAPDDGEALRGIVEHVRHSLGACSVTIRAAESRRQLAVAGRPWPHDTTIAESTLDGGAGIVREGAAPEAAEPIRAAGTTLGCIAVRWVSGTRPTGTRVTETLRVAAAAAASIVRGFGSTEPQPPGPHPDDVLGPGPAAEAIREAIKRAASVPYPVLIEGESGAGKEIVARAIHTRGLRRARRFCAINCAALTDDLLEAELFGHSRGAFTGAIVERAGLFEEADQGTLFLDEIGELSPRAQAKLLRVLQEGEVRRVGENHSRRVDARLVAATNRSLEAEVVAGRFRADLRFRVDVIRIRIPPLRERPDEVPWLASMLWADAARRVGSKAALSPDLVSALARYDWPGNVRELQNVIAALAVHAPRHGRVGPALLPPHVAGVAGRSPTSFDDARDEFERRFLRAALARAGGKKAIAARQLGMTRQGLGKMMKRLGIPNS